MVFAYACGGRLPQAPKLRVRRPEGTCRWQSLRCGTRSRPHPEHSLHLKMPRPHHRNHLHRSYCRCCCCCRCWRRLRCPYRRAHTTAWPRCTHSPLRKPRRPYSSSHTSIQRRHIPVHSSSQPPQSTRPTHRIGMEPSVSSHRRRRFLHTRCPPHTGSMRHCHRIDHPARRSRVAVLHIRPRDPNLS
jgi:hypothetical protein